MISFKILHHVPGRVRIEVPSIKGLSISTLKKLTSIPIPNGIIEVSPNPLTGSLVILYEPQEIDIVEYLKNMASNSEIQKIIGT